MDLDLPPDLVDFRDEVRTWLDEHAPKEPRPRKSQAVREFDAAWQHTQWEGGWAGINWPVEYGGRGLSLLQQMVWYEEYARLGFSGIDCFFVALQHAGPTLIVRGDKAQKSAHLPLILRGDEVWAQGFSEPNAGSDLGSLQTWAEVDGDELVVTGQKVWTSFADIADMQELLVRTNREAPKHKGITWVICDMHSPGIEIRPIATIDGDAHFAEVFYDEVRIPLSNVVGDIDDGWSVAMSTLSFERGTAFTASQVRLNETVEQLITLARERPGPDGRRPAIHDEELARRLATARAEVAALRSMTYAGISRNSRQEMPGPEGSILKLFYAELGQRVYRLAVDLLGPELVCLGVTTGITDWQHDYLGSYAFSIAGGTSEIMKNIIGERVLGLPR
ncbi:MAG TPA: acyl-CoA dehydrogenase family protein [Acidimicrobiales bacterium]|nr:acyl-CoA dehydrogenase family protein [Acidimicrobiales bacterium]